MMKLQTILKAFLLLFCWMTLGVACGPDCDVKDYKITDYEVGEYEGAVMPNGSVIITTEEPGELVSSDTVYYRLVGYQLTPSVESIASLGSGIFNQAMAKDCAPPDPTQKYTSISITSEQNFVTNAKTFNAGESLNSLFAVYGSENTSLNEPLINSYAFENGIMLVLMSPPKSIQPHRFHFTIRLDDGTEISSSSETLAISPAP